MKADSTSLPVPVDREISRQQRVDGGAGRLAAFKDRALDVGREESQPHQLTNVRVFDAPGFSRIGAALHQIYAACGQFDMGAPERCYECTIPADTNAVGR